MVVKPSWKLEMALEAASCPVEALVVKASESGQGYHAGPISTAAREQSQSYRTA